MVLCHQSERFSYKFIHKEAPVHILIKRNKPHHNKPKETQQISTMANNTISRLLTFLHITISQEQLAFHLSMVLLALPPLIYLVKFTFFRNPLPPGPTPLPVVGSIFRMCYNKPAFRWIHRMMERINAEIMCVRLGGVHVIAVRSPEIGREILRKQDAIFVSRPEIMAAEITSRGYLTTALVPCGDQWKKMRKIMSNELVSPARHRWFYSKRVEEADHLVRYVYNQCKSNGNDTTSIQKCQGTYI